MAGEKAAMLDAPPAPDPAAVNLPAEAAAVALRSSSSPTPTPMPTPSLITAPRLPSLRSPSDAGVVAAMNISSTPLGTVNAARRPGAAMSSAAALRAGALPQDMRAKMKAFHQSRQGAPPPTLRLPGMRSPPSPMAADRIGSPPAITIGSPSMAGPGAGGAPLLAGMNALRLSARPHAQAWTSAPVVPGAARAAAKPSLGARRGLALPGGLPGALPAGITNGKALAGAGGASAADGARVEGANGVGSGPGQHPMQGAHTGSLFNQFAQYVDTKAGTLRFAGKAVIHGRGVDFSSGSSFSISLDEVDNLEELGKGNYGTVYKVRHSRPQLRTPGMGLRGNRRHGSMSGLASTLPPVSAPDATVTSPSADGNDEALASNGTGTSATRPDTTGVIMAMKEIRLELDEAKFAAIIMELDVLHRCVSPFIVDFYGAFFQEGAVYICLEYMDGGSIDKIYGDGVPEPVLRKIALSTVTGLKALKDEHNIIHRDVKPTNILVNTRGQVKICDFGVSGNLVASIAKTNIGCQSYMAPERIATGTGAGAIAHAGANPGGGTYSVQSDIWSLGLTIIECAMGRYPYPPETYNNIFSQLSVRRFRSLRRIAIVDGAPPDLPEDGFSVAARDFVRGCLHKIPKLRPTYAMLLRHPWLAELLLPPPHPTPTTPAPPPLPHSTADPEVAAWVINALERRRTGQMGKADPPALHAAPLDASHAAAHDRPPLPTVNSAPPASVPMVDGGMASSSTGLG
ncbi:MAG: hypothetical protein M1826_005919 [Phylliscum demangeonii]|nr:MAG: hypothetical protein M1826_005919 [Phylliscum demangeonii]